MTTGKKYLKQTPTPVEGLFFVIFYVTISLDIRPYYLSGHNLRVKEDYNVNS